MDNYKSMFESRISAGGSENYQNLKPQGNLRHTLYLFGPMIWRVMRRSAWKDAAN